MRAIHRVGVDENGLGARLGPLVVTAVLARVDEGGKSLDDGGLPREVARDLDDSKRLVSHADVRLGEAWARALGTAPALAPGDLFRSLALPGEDVLRQPCPLRVAAQCWSTDGERFEAPDAWVERLRGHLRRLREQGLEILRVHSSVVCTRRLNQELCAGRSRFTVDLHAMEQLVLSMRELAGCDVHAVCGKVGGIGDYARFFGPLAGRLHVVLEQGAACSAYRFPGLGEIRFVRDADASDPLVMLASLVGKYVRELMMGRIARYYVSHGDEPLPSGYHDPRTDQFVAQTGGLRRRRRIPATCFERQRSGAT